MGAHIELFWDFDQLPWHFPSVPTAPPENVAFYSEVLTSYQLSHNNQSDESDLSSVIFCCNCSKIVCYVIVLYAIVCSVIVCSTIVFHARVASLPTPPPPPIPRFWPQSVATEQSIREVECCGGRRAISYAIVSPNILLCNSCLNILLYDSCSLFCSAIVSRNI